MVATDWSQLLLAVIEKVYPAGLVAQDDPE
jgi:hypothetical protein